MRKIKIETRIILLLLLLTSLLPLKTYSQTFNVEGNVSTDSTVVKYALVSFIDETDLNKTYTAITDTFGNYQLELITDVAVDNPFLPQNFELEQNYPNPFLTETTIQYKLEKESDVTVKIYDILGQEVKTFKQGLELIGVWNKVGWEK